MRFPARPLGEVTAKYVRQAGCPSHVAIATLDFEPLPEDRVGYAFVDETGQDACHYADALNHGIQLRLAGVPFSDLTYAGSTAQPAGLSARLDAGIRLGGVIGAPFVAVKVTLRGMTIHAVDSSTFAFRRAGWLGAQRAVELDAI